jgi:hypothetical protein
LIVWKQGPQLARLRRHLLLCPWPPLDVEVKMFLQMDRFQFFIDFVVGFKVAGDSGKDMDVDVGDLHMWW